MKSLLLFLPLALLITSCNKPNPNPESLDPIYDEMSKTAEEFKKSVAEERAGVADLEKTKQQVKPQTGQLSYAMKRLREAQDKLNHAEQMQRYWELRAEARKVFDRTSYMKAWNAHKLWPDPREYEEYKQVEKAQNQRPGWDLKARFVEAGLSPPKSGVKEAPKKEGEEKPAEKKE